ncbi:MAG: type II toxin-antitoxin system Phd/YefM family antitoxin [Magnetococcales bacterium]|nr:type II toxin-antitoxin system Phd/YefM family antitoxin [Magnetococcales bacterium]
MNQVNLFNAKAQLSNLVHRAAAGEEIIIAKNGIPQARLVPLGSETNLPPRSPGRLKGKIQESADFNQTPDEIITAFEGG